MRVAQIQQYPRVREQHALAQLYSGAAPCGKTYRQRGVSRAARSGEAVGIPRRIQGDGEIRPRIAADRKDALPVGERGEHRYLQQVPVERVRRAS